MTDPDPPDCQTDDHLATQDYSLSIPYCKANIFRLEAECGKKLEDYVRKRLRDDPDTIKVVEECWMDLLRKWRCQGELTEPRALLFRLAHCRVIDRIRQINRRAERPQADLSLLDDSAAALMSSLEFVPALVIRVDVRAALAELPSRQREVLRFIFGCGLDYKDTAALMACSVSSVGNLLRTAKANLKKSPRLVGYRVSSLSSPPEVNK